MHLVRKIETRAFGTGFFVYLLCENKTRCLPRPRIKKPLDDNDRRGFVFYPSHSYCPHAWSLALILSFPFCVRFDFRTPQYWITLDPHSHRSRWTHVLQVAVVFSCGAISNRLPIVLGFIADTVHVMRLQLVELLGSICGLLQCWKD